MKIWLTGGEGQLGRMLQRTAPDSVTLLAPNRIALDLSDSKAVETFFAAEQPDLIINTAAYTAVDKAEDEIDAAYALNRDLPAQLAQLAAKTQIPLIHISTDYVFDGASNEPYAIDAQTNPIGIYGHSKRAGEEEILKHHPQATIIRTAWVYGPDRQNFMKTMLRLMMEKDSLRVVSDQVGTPTSTRTLADFIWKSVIDPRSGIYHLCDGGFTSWYEFALAIQEEAMLHGLLNKAIPITPITTTDYPTRARRPAYSVLDKSRAATDYNFTPPDWRHALQIALKDTQQELDNG